MSQRVLALGVRSWTPKEPNSLPRFYISFASGSPVGRGMDAIESAASATVFEALKEKVPCWTDVDVALAGSYQGQGKTLVASAKVVAPLAMPSL